MTTRLVYLVFFFPKFYRHEQYFKLIIINLINFCIIYNNYVRLFRCSINFFTNKLRNKIAHMKLYRRKEITRILIDFWIDFHILEKKESCCSRQNLLLTKTLVTWADGLLMRLYLGLLMDPQICTQSCIISVRATLSLAGVCNWVKRLNKPIGYIYSFSR